MLTFLFWNMGGDSPPKSKPNEVRTRKNRLLGILRNLTAQHDVDFLMVAECPLGQAEVLSAVNHDKKRPYREPDAKSFCDRIKLYPRFPSRYISLRDESPYY